MFKNLVSKISDKVAPKQHDQSHAPVDKLFPKTDPLLDGEDCLHDCDSCTISYPRKFDIEMSDEIYGGVKQWGTHLVVATGKTDWVRDVADEEGSIMEAVEKGGVAPTNGKLKLSASNIPLRHRPDGSTSSRVLIFPSFVCIEHVTPAHVPALIKEYVSPSSTSTTPLVPRPSPYTLHAAPPPPEAPSDQLYAHPCPHRYVVLLCSQKTRDARCGQSAPLLLREFERQLRPLGLYRDLNDERPGGCGIYFISHVGGHKYSANVIIYRRADAMGNLLDGEGGAAAETMGAGQCIWLARVKPADVENIVKYTILQGKVVKPELQLRGGFDRGRGLVSW